MGGIGESYKVLILVMVFFPAFSTCKTDYSHSINTILIINSSKYFLFFSQTAIVLQI